MSKYSDAEKAAYWRKKATQARSTPKKKAYSRSKYNPEYTRVKMDGKNEAFNRRAIRNETMKNPGIIAEMGGKLGSVAGGIVGGPWGSGIGDFLGGKLGHLAEKITGFGDYKVVSNSILKGGMSPPYVVNSMNKGSVIVRHREFIGDIIASTAFTVLSYPINPGVSLTFPWLSQIAASFEQYRMRGCLFEFLSTSSDALLSSATSTALGTINMATQYDVAHPAFTDKRSMLNHEFANSAKPSCTFIHPIECKKSRTPISELYTREGPVPTGNDPHLYDLGNFQIATEGMQAAGGVLGELWVTYEVELFKQQFNILSYTDFFDCTGLTNISLLGTTHLPNPGNSIEGSINVGGTQYLFPRDISSGKYLFTWTCYGTMAGNVGSMTVSPTNGTILDVWKSVDSISGFVQSPASGVSTLFFMFQTVVQVTSANCIVQFNSTNIPNGTPRANLFVTRLGDDI